MKTKIISAFTGFLFLAVMFTSCEKFLDIEPQLAVSDDAVYGDHEGVINALHGAYALLGGPQLYAGTNIFHSDLVANSGQVRWRGTFIQYEQMNTKNMDPNDGFITGKWIRSYWIIDMVNNVLNNLEVVNEANRARVEGEARFIRGIVYYELVRFYAAPYVAGNPNSHPGVPLILRPTAGITDDDYPARETVANVYQAILNDLNSAKQLLSGFTKFGENNGRATASNAAAFLARVHMAMENWEAAANEANFVISNFGGYDALHSTPRAAFNNDGYTSEDVFMIIQNATSNAGQANDGIGTFFASLEGYGRSDIHIQEMHMNVFEEGDLRATITEDPDIRVIADVPGMYYIGIGTRPNNLMSSKWGKFDANINVIRLAEMILTRGEANFRNGTSIGAAPLADINAIRERAGLVAWDNLTLDLIWEERYREMCFEGRLLDDTRRFRRSVTIPEGPEAETVLPWDSPRLVLPIPQREMDVNPNLVQNVHYQ
ncbi:MAG: RagB/SusD family nutrient uptake outer membrane protein [Bacteroidales bacterium]|nr:RagB/SusD family nutrient uptake outer membrane protein [Bacteroidales bacterium]